MPGQRNPDKRKISAWVTDSEREEILIELSRLGFANLSDFLHALAENGIDCVHSDKDKDKPCDLDAT